MPPNAAVPEPSPDHTPAAPAAPAAPAPATPAAPAAPAAPETAKAPEAPAPSPAVHVNVAELEAEVAKDDKNKDDKDAAAPAATTDAPTPKKDRWQVFLDNLEDIPDEPHDKLLDGIDAKTVARLPAEARAIVRHLVAQRAKDIKDAAAAKAQAEKAIAEQRAELAREGRALLDREAQFAALFKSDAMKELLGKADEPDEGIDPLTPEGQKKLLEIHAARNFKAFTAPFRDAASEVQNRAAYHDFKASHPRMENPAFLKDMRALMETRKAAGQSTALADLHDLVEAKWLLREDAARRDADRKARAASAAHVARETTESDPDAGAPIPNWVTTKGYRGETGTRAENLFLLDHPKAAAAINRAHRAGRSTPAA